jgi:hypothetical protein
MFAGMLHVAVINGTTGTPYFITVFAGSVYANEVGDRVTDPNTTLSIMVILPVFNDGSNPSIDSVFCPATVVMLVTICFDHV